MKKGGGEIFFQSQDYCNFPIIINYFLFLVVLFSLFLIF